MSLFRKKISLTSAIRNNIPELILFLGCIVIFIILLRFTNFILALICSVVVFVLCLRLFLGKLKIKDGNVILFWGLPGSGKTMALNSVASYNKKRFNRYIVGNEEFADSSKICDAVLPRDAIGFFAPPVNSLLCIDEASLNGWDNRDWAKNFCPESLSYWKKVRHYFNAILISNQGFAELDCKIRDSLTSSVYYVTNHGWYSKAIRLDKSVKFDEHGVPVEGYKMPSIIDRLIDSSCCLYFVHFKVGKLFKTHNPDPLIPLDDLPSYDCIKSGKSVKWVRRVSNDA